METDKLPANELPVLLNITAPSPEDRAQLLVFSLAGRLGSGASFVGHSLRDELFAYRYEVVIVDVSLLIIMSLLNEDEDSELSGPELLKSIENKFHAKYPKQEERTRVLQDTGNNMRAQYGNDILARLAVSFVIAKHLKDQTGVANRQAFIIDSLKRPEEVEYLRKVFGSAYFAIGVVSTDVKRQDRLQERKGYDLSVFQLLSEKDRKEHGIVSGQRAVDTVLKSDYFFANDYATKDQIKPEISRFLALIFNSSMCTPRQDEFAMNVAYKAAARSACLSRQVGSAIVDEFGQLVATGCNDVPKYGGGLYSTESNNDQRCWARGGKCYNDEEKAVIIQELVDCFGAAIRDEKVLAQTEGLSLGKAELEEKLGQTLKSVLQGSRIRQLIEFSRAVHAEMNAIMTIARLGKGGVVRGTLYCTTYPCHNCTKHIIDVGITRLVYLEPYEKSLAKKLHADAVSDADNSTLDKVVFQLYGGVAPSRYSEFFEMRYDRKLDGKYIDRSHDKSQLPPLVRESAEELWRRIDKEVQGVKQEI